MGERPDATEEETAISWPGGPGSADVGTAEPEAGRRGALHAVDARLRRVLPGRAYTGLRTLARRNPGRGRLLPDFVIIGAAKAGTTSLYAWLGQHPYVEPAKHKEVHYFDYNYPRGDDWYRMHFPLSQRTGSVRRRATAVRS